MILVTGGTGLVGSHLLYHLTLQNDKIRAIYRIQSSLDKVKQVFSFYTSDATLFDKIEWFLADITQVPAMIPAFEGVKYVYHCAAFISFNSKDYIEMRKVNIHGTAIVVNLAIDAKIEKLCFVSSIAAVGDAKVGSEIIDEDCEWNKELDNSGYSITKFGAEMEVWRASQEGVNVIIVNPGVILGSGFWNSGSGRLFSQVYTGFKYYTEGITGFVAVQDVVKPMIELMQSEIKNERFILVSENKSFKDIFFLIADAFGKKRPSKKIKSWQTAIFWRIAWLLSKITRKAPLLSKYSARSAHTVSKYSSKKIQKELKYGFESIEKSIERVCKNYPKD
ncbi:SDR family oxidoreductase [Polaribacter porphyrae]|uniref:NAD-dependent epimerase n=1 Tax=Polaribacter porphyrae TaxID=1137780 RepID=A0A2S7WR12_9FLAO|nr:SDR family oxidoreductase [Polaribacter porphyrae]PQJ80033.1 NAD-dependent epimerase [Polaribacter porphyrae]